MRIDALTVIAQVANFLVLVLLLRRFLYRPVAAAIAKRQQRIAEQLAEAAAREERARAETEQLERERGDLAAGRERLLEEAHAAAEAERLRLVEGARLEVAATERRWREDLGREQRTFLEATLMELARAAEGIARRALGDLADADLQERAVRLFLARVGALDEPTRLAFAQHRGSLVVATAFALSPDSRRAVERGLKAQLREEVELRFDLDPALVCGVQLRAPGRVLGWSIDDYLESVHDRIAERIAEAAASAPPGATAGPGAPAPEPVASEPHASDTGHVHAS
jgi:F-type H+-transporting ATPase subunit b